MFILFYLLFFLPQPLQHTGKKIDSWSNDSYYVLIMKIDIMHQL